MLFWHLGVTPAVVLFTLGRRRIDYRVVLLGAILPDLIDKPVGRLFFEERFQTSRLWGHTLAFGVGLALVIMLVLRGPAARRWFVLPMACLIHLALDGMWGDPVTLFWPLFGTEFPPDPSGNYWLEVLLRPWRHPVEGLKEAAGLGVLVYLAFAFGLQRKAARRTFWRTGELPPDARRPADGHPPGGGQAG